MLFGLSLDQSQQHLLKERERTELERAIRSLKQNTVAENALKIASLKRVLANIDRQVDEGKSMIESSGNNSSSSRR